MSATPVSLSPSRRPPRPPSAEKERRLQLDQSLDSEKGDRGTRSSSRSRPVSVSNQRRLFVSVPLTPDSRKDSDSNSVENISETSVSMITSPSLERNNLFRYDFDNTHSNAATMTSEALARKQLLAELREASTLMADSQTPEAALFWKNHVISLQTRLRSLHNETQPTHSYQRNSNHPATQPRHISPPKRSIRHSQRAIMEKSTKTSHNLVSEFAGNSKIASNSHFFHPPLEPTNTQTSQPTQYHRPKRDHNLRRVPSENVSHAPGITPPRDIAPRQLSYSAKPITHSTSVTNADRVNVVSPADLPAGYRFEAQIDGHPFLAIVPNGGVKKGETFSCIMREITPNGPFVPMGHWRDGLCDCLKFGPCHPILLNSIICPLLSLGQVMTRLKLDAFGRPTKFRANTWSTMWIITLFWILMNILIVGAYYYQSWIRLNLTVMDVVAFALVNGIGVVYSLYAVSTTRTTTREMYNIQEYRCYDLEDPCCATFCMPCTICQLQRHTVPFQQVEAQTCTMTGVPRDVNLDFIFKSSTLR